MSAPAALVTLAVAKATTTTTVPAGGQVPSLTGSTALLALLVVVAVVMVTGKAKTLADLPLAIVAALGGLVLAAVGWLVGWAARKLNVGWPQWCWLAVTAVLVGQANRQGIPPRPAWTAAGLAWGGWLALRLRAGHRQRTAPKRHAKAMHKTAEAMQQQARTTAAARTASRAKRAARAASKAAQPIPAVPPAPAAASRRPVPPAPQPQYWTPPVPGLDPVLPRWLGGGRLRRRRR